MMAEANMFELVKIIKAAKGDPSAMTDAIWGPVTANRSVAQKKQQKSPLIPSSTAKASACLRIFGRAAMTVCCRTS